MFDPRTEFGNVTYRFVRILALKQGRNESESYFCQFEDGSTIEANYHEIWVEAWHPKPPEHYFHSIIIHCPVPLFINDKVSFQKIHKS